MTDAAPLSSLPYRYGHSGLGFASQIELPEWGRFAAETGVPDVTILRDDTLAGLDLPLGFGIVDSGALAFRQSEIGTWAVADGSAIRFAPLAGAGEREIRLFTLGSAWGAIGYQRGFAMLHGSAVAIPGGAAFFCGDSGAGKSTTAAALAARGHALLADDLSRVDAPDADRGPTLLHPSAGRMKLWRSAIAHFGWQDRPMTRDYMRDEKFHLEGFATQITPDPVPLRAIYALEWGPSLRIERLRGAEAVSALAETTRYRPWFLDAMGLMAQQLVHCAQIAAAVPVYRLVRPRDFSALGAMGDALEAQWDALQE